MRRLLTTLTPIESRIIRWRFGRDDEDELTLKEIGDKYKYGFVTDIEAETVPRGLNEDIVRFISNKKNEPAWMLEARLEAYRRERREGWKKGPL